MKEITYLIYIIFWIILVIIFIISSIFSLSMGKGAKPLLKECQETVKSETMG
jgi:uncharacterized protein YpmB